MAQIFLGGVVANLIANQVRKRRIKRSALRSVQRTVGGIQIRVDDTEIRNYLANMPEQVDYAVSVALNDAAFQVRRHIVDRVWPASVDVKQRGFAGRAFRVLKANKRRLVSAVYADPLRVGGGGIEAIHRVEEGLRHYPFNSRWLAVPTRNALTPAGRLNAVGKRALQRTEPDTFVADLQGKGPAIWKRKRKGGLTLLFVLKPSVPTPQSFDFRREAERKAQDAWQSAIRRAVIRAVKTAKR